MNCGNPGRLPPRRPAFAGRLLRLSCIAALGAALLAGPVGAYPCAPPGAQATAGMAQPRRAAKACERARPAPPRRGNADPVSFVFYLGLTLAVLIVPVAFWRREPAPRQ